MRCAVRPEWQNGMMNRVVWQEHERAMTADGKVGHSPKMFARRSALSTEGQTSRWTCNTLGVSIPSYRCVSPVLCTFLYSSNLSSLTPRIWQTRTPWSVRGIAGASPGSVLRTLMLVIRMLERWT